MFFVDGLLLFVVCGVLFVGVSWLSLFRFRCVSSVVCCSLRVVVLMFGFGVYRRLFVVRCSLFVVRCWLCVVCCSLLFVGGCLLLIDVCFGVCCLVYAFRSSSCVVVPRCVLRVASCLSDLFVIACCVLFVVCCW